MLYSENVLYSACIVKLILLLALFFPYASLVFSKSASLQSGNVKQSNHFLRTSTVSSDKYFNYTSGCISKFYETRTTQGNPPRYCRLNSFNYFDEHDPKMYDKAPDLNLECNYELKNIVKVAGNSKISIKFSITKLRSSSGGTSFQFQYNNLHYMWCNVADMKNGTYDVDCSISIDTIKSQCVAVSVLLAYENYNAYHDINGAKSTPTPCLLNNGKFSVCPSDIKHSINSKGVLTTDSSSQSSHQITSCLSSQATTYLIGSSHMRYVWDAIVDKYLDGRELLLSLPQHHSDASVGNVHYVSNLFIMQLPTKLQTICDNIHDSIRSIFEKTNSIRDIKSIPITNVVVQTLAWDLDYHPIRNVIEYSGSIKALVHTVEQLSNSICGQFINFVWVTAVPLPVCALHLNASVSQPKLDKQALMPCSGEGRGYRNNYVIVAANQHLTSQLDKITKPSDLKAFLRLTKQNKYVISERIVTKQVAVMKQFVTFVDAFDLIYSTHHESVCGLHFTCSSHKKNKEGKTIEMMQTTGGRAVVESILSSICQ